MARYDSQGRPVAVPKPEGGKKKGKKIFIDKVPKKELEQADDQAGHEDRKKQNNINRNFGKSVERKVAELTGGTRVPMSGAVKNGVHNLEGDVSVRSRDGKKVLVLVEVKGQTPRGDKAFQIKKSVLDQARKEAELQHAFPLVWYHLKGESHDEDWGFVPVTALLELIEGMKDVYEVEYRREKDNEHLQSS